MRGVAHVEPESIHPGVDQGRHRLAGLGGGTKGRDETGAAHPGRVQPGCEVDNVNRGEGAAFIPPVPSSARSARQFWSEGPWYRDRAVRRGKAVDAGTRETARWIETRGGCLCSDRSVGRTVFAPLPGPGPRPRHGENVLNQRISKKHTKYFKNADILVILR